MGSGEEAFSGCTDFFQKSNTSPIVFLYRAKQRLWKGVFATLTGAGLVVLGVNVDTQRLAVDYHRDTEKPMRYDLHFFSQALQELGLFRN